VPPKSLKDAVAEEFYFRKNTLDKMLSAPLCLSFLALTLPFLVHLLCERRLFLIGKDQKWIW